MTHEVGSTMETRRDSVRIVLESLIILLLVWVGNSILSLRTDTAVVQSQLIDIRANLANIPKLQLDVTTNKSDITQMRKDIDDIKLLEKAR